MRRAIAPHSSQRQLHSYVDRNLVAHSRAVDERVCLGLSLREQFHRFGKHVVSCGISDCFVVRAYNLHDRVWHLRQHASARSGADSATRVESFKLLRDNNRL